MKQHRIFSIFVIFALLLALIPAGEAPVQAQAPETEITRDTLYVPGEVVVGFDRDLPRAEAQTRAVALAGSVGAMVVDQYANMALLSVDPAADVFALAERLSGQEGVAYAEPNYISWIPEANPVGAPIALSEITHDVGDDESLIRGIDTLSDMRTVAQGGVASTYPSDEWANWGSSWIGHDIIWSNKNPSPVVCVIDTGVDDRHPDLKGRVIKGYDFVNDDKIPEDDNGHGTHVAGIIAAKTGNGIGPAGISNGKVLMIKAFSAQGQGTEFDVASAIRLCADNKAVKVISVSSGCYVETTAEYDALDYAINEKGKLVAAMAGDYSRSIMTVFPAGWAKDATIGHGLLSVGAVRAPMPPGMNLWVDTNGNGEPASNEYYNDENCATSKTNYGSWVEMLAPGESVYSTTPVSNPFWNNYFKGISSGYDSMDGTGIAAAHVAGAAARVWSIYPTETNTWIHDRLIDRGKAPTVAVDADLSIYPYWPYNGDEVPHSWYGEEWGVPFDRNGDGIDDTIRVPFCWPFVGGSFGTQQDTSGARMLDVAAAMDRGVFTAEVTDALTGLPLLGATVTVKHGVTGKTIATAKVVSADTNLVDLINIPADGVPHKIYVSKKGYTAGNQPFAESISQPGVYILRDSFRVGVPPKKNTTVVANWKPGTYYDGKDSDLYVWLPAGAPSGVVGCDKFLGGYDYPSIYRSFGSLMDYPYARWYRDGSLDDDLSMESITLVNYPRTSYPYYLQQYPNGVYNIVMGNVYGGEYLDLASPIVRVWNNGKNVFTVEKTDPCGLLWLALSIERDGNTSHYTSVDVCDSLENLGLYTEANAIFSVSRGR